MQKAYYAHELPDEDVEAIANSEPSKEAEELNYLTYSVRCSKCNETYKHKVKAGLSNKELYAELSITKCRCTQ